MLEKEKDETSDSTNEKEKTTDHKEKPGFWDETKENVSIGAKIIGEEAKHIGEKIAKYSETIFGKIKDNTNEVIKYGFDLTNEGVHKAQEIAENLKDDFEVKKLNIKKKEVSAQLGMKIYLAIKNTRPKDKQKQM